MILVVGATGRLGGNVVRMLRQARAEVRCLIRSGSEYYWLNDTGAGYFFGDLRNALSMRRAARGCDYVIHAGGVRVESTDNHHGVVTLEGSKALIDASVEAGVKHFVYLSCHGVSAPDGVVEFEFRAEVEAYLQASGLSYSILRPTVFAAEFTDIVKAESDPLAAVFSNGEATVRPIARRDAAIYAIAALDHPAMKDRVVTLAGPDAMTVREAAERAATAAGTEQPRFLSGASLSATRRVASLLAGKRYENYCSRQKNLFSLDADVDATALREAVGIPLTSYDAAVADALAESHPSQDPTARDTRVVHRQFQATVYEPGEIAAEELPDGPVRLSDAELNG